MSDLVQYTDRALVWLKKPEKPEECQEDADKIQEKFNNHYDKNLPFIFGDFCNRVYEIFGESGTQYWPDIGKAESTFVSWQFTCKQFPPETRIYDLSFSHYKEVAGLDPEERNKWLKLAEEKRLSVFKMRKLMRGEPLDKPKMAECPACHVTFEVK